MIIFPVSTEFKRKIPKQKFYDKINISGFLRRIFIDDVKTVYWSNKLASSTLNIKTGLQVSEIEVIIVELNHHEINTALLKQIDKEIPYHILFLMKYESKYQAWIGYKEVALSGTNAFNVDGYYHTQWLDEHELPIKIEGINLDDVYKNFVFQIAGSSLQKKDEDHDDLKIAVEREKKRQILIKRIELLESKIAKERQLNKQLVMHNEQKKLKQELENL